jgi:hypothetical protein
MITEIAGPLTTPEVEDSSSEGFMVSSQNGHYWANGKTHFLDEWHGIDPLRSMTLAPKTAVAG